MSIKAVGCEAGLLENEGLNALLWTLFSIPSALMLRNRRISYFEVLVTTLYLFDCVSLTF